MEYNGNPRMPGSNDAQLNRSAGKPMGKKPGRKLSLKPTNMVFAAFFAAVAVLVVAVLIFMTIGSGKTESDLIKKEQYQAVFLSDASGQVYFGKLKSLNAQYYELTDIFYVRVENAVQPDTTQQSAAQQNISLAKLGNELHGPEDAMYISRDKVLFWENLKDDGQVVTAIKEFKANGDNPNANNQNQTQNNNQPANNNANTNTNNTNTNNSNNNTNNTNNR